MIRLYIALAVLTILGVTHWQAYRSGIMACENSHQEAVTVQQTNDANRVVELAHSDVKREIRYVEKRIVVREAVDGCLDRPMPAAVLDILRNRDNRAAQPRTHATLFPPTPPG